MKKRFIFPILIVAILVMLGTATASPAPPIITNGSFETGDYTGWTLWEGGASTDPNRGIWGIAMDGDEVNLLDSLFDYHDNTYVTLVTFFGPITFESSDGDYVAYNLNVAAQTHRICPKTSPSAPNAVRTCWPGI